MPTPPLNNIVNLDFSNPSCFNGSGLTVNDLSASNNDFALADLDYVFTTTYGGELYINTINLATTLNHSGLTGYSYGTAAFSFHMWVQINQLNASNLTQIWSLNFTGGAGSHNNPFCGVVSGNNFFFTDGTDTLTTSTSLSLDTWYLVSISKPAGGSSNDVDIYINGVGVPFTGGSSSVINVDNTTPVNSLSAYAAGQPVWNSAQTIGEYKFYNVAISASDVTDYYNSTKFRFQYPVATAKYDVSDPSSYPGTGSTIFDISGNSFDLTINNATYNTGSGIVPNISFDGTSTSFGYYNGEIGNIVSGSPAVFSFNIWLKAYYDNSSPGFECCWSYGKDGSGIPSLWLDRNANDPTYDGGSSNPLISSGYAAPYEWICYSVVSDGTTVTLYIDGVSYGSASNVGRPIGTPAKFLLGSFDTADFITGAYNCDFEFNYLEIHDIALTGTQVLGFYNNTKSRYLLPDPYISYDFSDPACYSGAGSTVFDLTANNYDGDITGPTYVYDGTASYFQFNSGSDYITSSTVDTTALSDFTINVWCYPENSSTENVVLSLGIDSPGGIPFIDYSLFTPGKFLISNGSGVATVESSIPSPINEWYMVTYTKTGTTAEIYINGVSGGTASGSITLADPVPLRLGGYSPGIAPNFYGRIAVFEIYGAGLTDNQVEALFNLDSARFIVPPVPVIVGNGRSFGQGFNG